MAYVNAIVLLDDDDDIRVVVDPAEIVEGGGGSFLSANTARVDPSGDDGTGEVGDLGKPFLTVQAAIDAIVALADTETAFVIDIGSNQYDEESLTIAAQLTLVFVGSNCDTSTPFGSLTASAQMTIYGVNVALGNIITSGRLTMFLQESRSGDITSTASGETLTIGSYYNTGAIGEVVADDVEEIYIFGVVPVNEVSILSANATEVTLRTVRQNLLGDQYSFVFDVTATAAAVDVTDSLLGDLECDSLSQWIDSRVTGSITLGEGQLVEAHDVVLNPAEMDFSTLPDSDPEILGRAWMDSGVFTISQGPP